MIVSYYFCSFGKFWKERLTRTSSSRACTLKSESVFSIVANWQQILTKISFVIFCAEILQQFSLTPKGYYHVCFFNVVKFYTARGQTTPQMFHQFLDISHYFALLKKYKLFLHQTWQKSRRPIANYIYVKNVSKCQSCDVTVMTSCFLPLLKFLICIFCTMCWKEDIKGSWNLKKICPYHKNYMKYGIFKYEK